MIGERGGIGAHGAGFQHVDDPSSAEIIVVNTCGFIGDAKKESIATIFEMAELKESGACEKLVVTGCLAERSGAELAEALLSALADAVIAHLRAQAHAGADVLQIFDTWGGLLPAPDYARFILPGQCLVQNHFLTDVQNGMNADHTMQVIGQEFIRTAGPAALQSKVNDVCIADVGIQLVQGTDAIDIGQGLDIQGE